MQHYEKLIVFPLAAAQTAQAAPAAQTAQAASAAQLPQTMLRLTYSAPYQLLSSNALAIVPTTSPTTTFEPDAHANSGSATTFVATPSASNVMSQSFDDPFGDSPFRALPSSETVQPQPTDFHAHRLFPSNHEPDLLNHNTDILADILPPPGPFTCHDFTATLFSSNSSGGFFPPQGGPTAPITSHVAPPTPTDQLHRRFYGSPSPCTWLPQTHTGPAAQLNGGNFHPQQGSVGPVASQAVHQAPTGPGLQHNSDVLGNLFPQTGPNTSMGSHQALPSSTGALSIVAQPPKDKFEPKSAVWADTLSRGLVNFNISGAKINPLNDIGIDLIPLTGKKRGWRSSQQLLQHLLFTMGKAMGSGSGIGRAGASVLRVPGPAMGMGMGMGGGPGGGMGMGGYGGMNQPMGWELGWGWDGEHGNGNEYGRGDARAQLDCLLGQTCLPVITP
ncbi:unnamed protein product [Prunus armeniaca]|uniref:Uncharacterized protein n=1 Tax=Prunus armeniaca TaxID=36596 RepID=A0A6J5UI81_PRUAR|nr:unnamed protein product [Prunus armeniaca]